MPVFGAMSTGIFCVENFSERLTERGTVKPLLEFMAARDIRFVHRTIDSGTQLDYYIDRWSWLNSYQLGYLALHGEPDQLRIGGQGVTLRSMLSFSHEELPPESELTVEERAVSRSRQDREWLALYDKVLYVGSCSTLAAGGQRELDYLRAATGAIAICGYTKDVFWYDVAAFELILLSELAHALSLSRPKPGVERALKRVGLLHEQLVNRLGFVSSPRHDS